MGLINQRAICPSCGGKIHTQAALLGFLTAQTGRRCQWCGIALTGRVRWTNKAVSVEGDAARQRQRAAKTTERRRPKDDLDRRLIELLGKGPVTIRDAAQHLDVSRTQVISAQTRLGKQIKASGVGKERTLRLTET